MALNRNLYRRSYAALKQTSPRPTEPAVAAAYQVTARMLASEQQVIWARTQGFFALNAVAVAVVGGVGSLGAQRTVGTLGVILAAMFLWSLRRSWRFRGHFSALLRSQEATLGLGSLGPLTTGEGLKGGMNQPSMSYVLIAACGLSYVMLLLHGLGHFTWLDPPTRTSLICCDGTFRQ